MHSDALGLNDMRFKNVTNKEEQKKRYSLRTNLISNKDTNKLFMDLNGKDEGFGNDGLFA